MITPLYSFGKDVKKSKVLPPDLHRLLLVMQYYYRVKLHAVSDDPNKPQNLQAQMALRVLEGLIPNKVRKALQAYSDANWKVGLSMSVHGRPLLCSIVTFRAKHVAVMTIGPKNACKSTDQTQVSSHYLFVASDRTLAATCKA